MAFGASIGSTVYGPTKVPIDLMSLRKQHNKWLGAHERMVVAQVAELGTIALKNAWSQRLVKNRTGGLQNGWKRAFRRGVNFVSVALINRAKQAWLQERGTGLWGPSRMPIVPKRAPYLRFRTAAGQWVTTKSVKGVPPKWIGRKAVTDAFVTGNTNLPRACAGIARKF